MSERAMGNNAAEAAAANDSLHHSKSVPNLIANGDQQPDARETPTAAVTESAERSFSFLDPDKRMRVTDNTLKLIQKQALLDYYERHSSSTAVGSGSRKSTASSGSGGARPEYPPDSGFYSPTEKAGTVTNVEVHRQVSRAADLKSQVRIRP